MPKAMFDMDTIRESVRADEKRHAARAEQFAQEVREDPGRIRECVLDYLRRELTVSDRMCPYAKTTLEKRLRMNNLGHSAIGNRGTDTVTVWDLNGAAELTRRAVSKPRPGMVARARAAWLKDMPNLRASM
jgi:hypothetical protein